MAWIRGPPLSISTRREIEEGEGVDPKMTSTSLHHSSYRVIHSVFARLLLPSFVETSIYAYFNVLQLCYPQLLCCFFRLNKSNPTSDPPYSRRKLQERLGKWLRKGFPPHQNPTQKNYVERSAWELPLPSQRPCLVFLLFLCPFVIDLPMWFWVFNSWLANSIICCPLLMHVSLACQNCTKPLLYMCWYYCSSLLVIMASTLLGCVSLV